MNKLILATGVDDKYLNSNIFLQYLKSIEDNSNFDKNIIVHLSHNNIKLDYKNIDVFKVNPDTVIQKNKNNCLQHGEFLNSESFENISLDDIIIFTDGDMILQRPLMIDEINFLRNLKDGDVYVGYNASPNDTLHDEYHRLSPKNTSQNEFSSYDFKTIKVYNTGVLCMNKRTWLNLKDEYIKNFSKVDSMFSHYAKQQWLISLLLHICNFNIIEMGYDIHNHRHYPSPIGTQNINGTVTYNGKTVLFKHKWI